MPIPEARKLAIVQGVIGMGIIGALAYVGLGLRPRAVPGWNPRSTLDAIYGEFTEGSRLTGMGVADSPVKIVGGSMTFRSKDNKGWTDPVTGNACTNLCVTAVPAGVSGIQLDRVVFPGTTGPPGVVTMTIATSWQIQLDARNQAGTADNTPPTGVQQSTGVYVCTKAAPDPKNGCDISSGVPGNTIFIGPKDPNSLGVGFWPNGAPQAYFDSPDASKRYMDQKSVNCAPGGFCEYIWRITISYKGSDGTTYNNAFLCPDGQCRVYILPLPPSS
jgi:hypothetical protein